MKIAKKDLFQVIASLTMVSFATAASPIACLLALSFGYPFLIIYYYKIRTRRSRSLFLYGCGVIYFLVQMRWMGLAQYQGKMIILVYFLLSLLFALPYLLLGYCLPKEPRDLTPKRVIFASFVFTFFEYARLWVVSGFPFHTVGLILTAYDSSLQLLSVVGLYGLSFIVIGQALLGVKSYYTNRPLPYLSALVLPFCIGLGLLHMPHPVVSEKKEIKVAIVQTGLLVEQKWRLDGYEGSFISLKNQIENLWEDLKELERVDMIILPESCLSGDARLDRFTKEEIGGLLSKDFEPFFSGKEKYSYIDIFSAISLYINTDILMGLLSDGYNSAFYFSQGRVIGRYNKRHLVPLGEYIPFNFLQNLAKRYGLEASFIPGEKGDLFQSRWKIAPSICFDEGFPEDFLSYQKQKPDFHVNVTNDAWFKGSVLTKSHFYLGKVRSVENGIYTLRACNSGISAVIDPYGKVLSSIDEISSTGELKKGVVIETLQLYNRPTVFSFLGNFGWAYLLAGSIVGLSLFESAKSLNKKSF